MMYGGIFLLPRYKINYVILPENYVNMQDNCVNMQDNYVNMQDYYDDMQVTNLFRESDFNKVK